MNQLIDAIKNSKNKLYIAMTGGGSACLPTLLEEGGASASFLGATIPYSEHELGSLIGSYSKATSVSTAISMADVVCWRSEVDAKDYHIVGIGMTCSLKKSGDERADREHKICLAVKIITDHETKVAFRAEIVLNKGRTRKQEEDLTGNLILAVADQYMNGNSTHFLKNKQIMKWIGLTDKDQVNVL